MIAGYVLDSGFFIGVEKRHGRAIRLWQRLRQDHIRLVTPAGVVAQSWRGGTGAQHPVAVMLPEISVVDLNRAAAKAVGMVLALSRTSDPVDAHVALLAQDLDWPVVTSDPDDLARIDKRLHLVVV